MHVHTHTRVHTVGERETSTHIEMHAPSLTLSPNHSPTQATAVIRELESARATARGPDAPEDKMIIIAMTADVLKSTVEKCFKTGVDDYFPKPIRKQEFYRVLAAWAEVAKNFNPRLRCGWGGVVYTRVLLARRNQSARTHTHTHTRTHTHTY